MVHFQGYEPVHFACNEIVLVKTIFQSFGKENGKLGHFLYGTKLLNLAGLWKTLKNSEYN